MFTEVPQPSRTAAPAQAGDHPTRSDEPRAARTAAGSLGIAAAIPVL